jgi:hypothetical protein
MILRNLISIYLLSVFAAGLTVQMPSAEIGAVPDGTSCQGGGV